MKYFISLLLIWQMQVVYGQNSNDSLATLNTKAYIHSYWDNGAKLVTQPLRWKGKDWVKTGVVIGTTTALFFADKNIKQYFDNWNRPAAVSFGKTGDVVGEYYVMMGGSLAVLGIGALTKNAGLINFGQDALQAGLFTGAGTFISKELFGRTSRLSGTDYTSYWAGSFKSGNANSNFFSGHSSQAFSMATMIFLHSHKKWWVGVLSYGVASGIGVSRLQHRQHWASDVFFGAVVGSAVSTFVYKQNEKKRHPKLLQSK